MEGRPVVEVAAPFVSAAAVVVIVGPPEKQKPQR
jgi:hypothetical protein